jgi:hypothetical protein
VILGGPIRPEPAEEELHKLAALRLLSDGLGQLERHRQERIECGDEPTEVDRETAQLALSGMVTFCLDLGIESSPLVRLLGGLEALSAGSSASPMFAPAATPHRRPDSPATQGIKGRLAAIMEFQQQAGLARQPAAEWVARHLSPKMIDHLGSVKAATVNSWLAKWGGERGTPGSGRDGYLAMRVILADQRPNEPELKKMLAALERSLPS